MIRNSFVLILILVSACVLSFAQTPQPKKDKESAPRAFAWSFGDDGSYLGIQTQEVTRENFGKFGLRDVRGVAVEKVLENSPAQAAGLQNGDVIIRFNGEEITSTRKLTRLISEVAPDHQAKVTVLRNGNERDLNVTLGKRPAPKFENGNFEFNMPSVPGKIEIPDIQAMPTFPPMGEMPQIQVAPGLEGNDSFVWRVGSSRQIGVSVSPLTKQLADYFGVAEGGLLISNVRENSPAAKAGLKAGDVITEVNGKAVKGDFDLIRAIGEKNDGDVELTIIRDRGRQTIRVTPESVKGDLAPLLDDQDGQAPALRRLKIQPPASPGQPMVAPQAVPAPMIFARPGSRIL
jgi:membrane-associated protease RseP (regulator of RpoE activity)